MTKWNPDWKSEDYLNLRQVLALLNYDLTAWKDRYESIPNFAEPDGYLGEEPRWSPDLVREMRATVPRGNASRKIKWADQELLRTKVFGALHPTPIQIRSVSANLARGRRQLAEGNPPQVLPPEPVKHLFGHPLYDPQDVAEYLDQRPGYGNFTSGTDRRGYRGGRIPKGQSKAERALASASS